MPSCDSMGTSFYIDIPRSRLWPLCYRDERRWELAKRTGFYQLFMIWVMIDGHLVHVPSARGRCRGGLTGDLIPLPCEPGAS